MTGIENATDFEEEGPQDAQLVSNVLTGSETDALRAKATSLAQELEASSGSRELGLIDNVSALGVVAQRHAGQELDFLRTRVGDMLSEKGATGQLTKDLVELRMLLGKINPNPDGPSGIVRLLPFSQTVVKRLEHIAVRYETISRQVQVVERRLAEGQSMLRRDNVELRKLYEEVEEQQLPIERNAFLGEALIDELQRLMARTTDAMKKERIQTAIFDVAMRVQDLRTMQEVHTQFFVSIEMSRVNNSRLAQAVERTLSLTTTTLTVGLAIQAALSRQKRVLEATQRTRQYLGDLISANAASIKQHVNEIGDVYRSPVIAIEKLAQAHADLMEALNTAGRLEAEGIQLARTNIEKLKQLTTELSRRSLATGPSESVPLLEA
jgi:uncharacterized protein YaaN involved in tellurite resistance